MSEFGRVGGPLPHDQASTEEHFREVAEDVKHEKEADKVAEPPDAFATTRRRRWRFWTKRSS